MGERTDGVERALQAPTPAALLQALRGVRRALTLPDVQRLARRLASFEVPRQPLRAAVVRTYTTELLRPYWTFEALANGFELDLYEAPFGALVQELQPQAGLVQHAPEITYLLLRWEDIAPALAAPLMARAAPERAAAQREAIDRLVALLTGFRRALPGLLVLTLLPRFAGAELGLYDPMAAFSEGGLRADRKRDLAARLRAELPGVHFDDLDTLVEEIGRRSAFDARLWHSARFPFSGLGAQAVTRRLMTYAVLLKRPRAKCLALDADNTLWGGIIGEDGIDGIALGPDYPGSAYVAFQRRLLELRERGFVLALCSKNDEADVRRVLAEHPHQLLREQHFTALRVNWSPKPANLAAIADELRIGLDSMVFVDDSPQECLALTRALPEVLVVQTPSEPAELPGCLDDLARLEILGLTDEDSARTDLYAQERRRRALATAAADLEQYLASLQMTMTVGVDDERAAPRLAQLTQKTNQFNLTTRRYGEADIRRLMADPDWLVAHCSLADIFGDAGIVGVALVRGVTGTTAEFDSFLLSCRVIGRRAETAFLEHLLGRLASTGVRTVRAEFVPTAKNALVERFWSEHGFDSVGAHAYQLDLAQRRSPTSAGSIRVHALERAQAAAAGAGAG
jgi:FkbH-like protein